MNFFALDVETANSDFSSICQIGIAEFENGQVIDSWSSLINPEDYFDHFNIQIHGIDENKVKNAPNFEQISQKVNDWLSNKVTIHHMPFDRVALSRVCEKYNLNPIEPLWLDSAKVARRTWEEVAYKGYGLANLSKMLKITFEHHDALEDAIAAGKIFIEASKITGLDLEEWLKRINKPLFLNPDGSSSIKFDGNPEGPYYGENVVFTGSLNLTRSEAAQKAAELGCNVSNGVTKKTTMLVVGNQDYDKLAGFKKSSKHRKAEDLRNQGQEIKILTENDFLKTFELI